MVLQAIQAAENAVRQYGTRDPFEIIDARGIRLRFFDAARLPGYFTVVKRIQYIGLNRNADEHHMRTVAAHELGHSFLDYEEAAAGGEMQNPLLFTYLNGRQEQNANFFAAELLIPDKDILAAACHDAYMETVRCIHSHIDEYPDASDRDSFRQCCMLQFYEEHELPTIEALAAHFRVAQELIRFKLQALARKGLELPDIHTARSDFLRHLQN